MTWTSDKYKNNWAELDNFYKGRDYQLSDDKFMEGYKTWTGILITILGMFGVGYLVNADQLGSVINAVVQIVGVVVTVYGNYKAHQKISELKN